MQTTNAPPLLVETLVHKAIASQQKDFGEDYLTHAGIKGMRWGHRKAEDPSGIDHTHRNQVIVKTAIAAGAIAVGAILLKRGGFKLSTPASRKISLGGAKMSMRILQKSGRVMGTTSVKLGSTVGKTAVKGGTKLGGIVAKGSYKGAIAGSKAGARAVVQNGSKFYTNVLKKGALSTVKLGSHAMYKLTGRGRPIVNDVAKKSFNISPTDLLLNVRADKWGGRE